MTPREIAMRAGYTAGLERAAKEAERHARTKSKCKATLIAAAIRTLAHPPKEG